LRYHGRCYRAHDPRWSFSPLSGEGAAITGGRFNRKGEPTLYTSLELVTAVNECQQGFANRLNPLLLVQYDVDVEPIADLSTASAQAAAGVAHADLDCAWLSFQLAGREAPSWRVVDALKADGFAGLLAPSFAPDARPDHVNLILWRWGPDLPTQVRAYDPDGRLPTDQRSWPTPRT